MMTETTLTKIEVKQEEEIDTITKHLEVSNEETNIESIRAMENWHISIGRYQQLKTWTQQDVRSQKNCPLPKGGITHLAIPALHKGYIHKWPRRNKFARSP
jgi:hypothetical protein